MAKHPLDYIGKQDKDVDWSLVTYDEMVAFCKERQLTYSMFRRDFARLYQNAVDRGWILHLLPYIKHDVRSYRHASAAHERAMKRIKTKT
jgi:hypothetical protein